jgi:hypothetical protein
VIDFIIDGAPLFRLIRAASISYASIPHAAVDPGYARLKMAARCVFWLASKKPNGSGLTIIVACNAVTFATLCYSHDGGFGPAGLRLKRFCFAIRGAYRRSMPCSCQGSSPYQSADWLWPPAHLLKLPQTPQRHAGRPRLLSKNIQSGIQTENPIGHVRRVLHLARGGLLALAAPRGAGGTFKPLRRDEAPDARATAAPAAI